MGVDALTDACIDIASISRSFRVREAGDIGIHVLHVGRQHIYERAYGSAQLLKWQVARQERSNDTAEQRTRGLYISTSLAPGRNNITSTTVS